MGIIERMARDVNRPERLVVAITEEEENTIGRRLAREVTTRRSDYVAAVGNRLLIYVERTGIDYTFEVLDWPVANAFSLPGGKIFVTASMLDEIETEAELAGLLGHEIAHVELLHCIDRVRTHVAMERAGLEEAAVVIEILKALLLLAYSEEQEIEADEYGTWLAARAGYDPRGLRDLFGRMDDSEPPASDDEHRMIPDILAEAAKRYAATHPGMRERTAVLDRYIARQAWIGRRFYQGRKSHAARAVTHPWPDDDTVILPDPGD
jgi:predicted Zn-dependent protease